MSCYRQTCLYLDVLADILNEFIWLITKRK